MSFRSPDTVVLTTAQRTTAWYFFAMAGLFVVQTLVGAAAQHYRADLGTFFGIPLDKWLPYDLTRTWHVQLSIFWVVTSFLAIGIFITPLVARGREPGGQALLSRLLLGAPVVVVVGSLVGELASQRNWFHGGWSVFGSQSWEYLDLGRLWQTLLIIGLIFWVVILFRGLRGRVFNC
ncbi:cbb3-type cytochrome c oxidase subunit I [Streptomyces sp. YIM S03343]